MGFVIDGTGLDWIGLNGVELEYKGMEGSNSIKIQAGSGNG